MAVMVFWEKAVGCWRLKFFAFEANRTIGALALLSPFSKSRLVRFFYCPR